MANVFDSVESSNNSSKTVFDSIDTFSSGKTVFDTTPEIPSKTVFDLKPKEKSKNFTMDRAKELLYGEANPELDTAIKESKLQGMFGISPANPQLQAKYPVFTTVNRFIAGTVPYLIPGGGLAAIPLKFAAIQGSHEIVRQSTELTKENKNLNYFQRVGKVVTAGVSGAMMGQIFKQADLLKTIVQRVAARSGGAGAISGVESLAQDVESGKEPDLHSSLINAGVNAATIGIIGAMAEVPALRGAVVQEANRLNSVDPRNVGTTPVTLDYKQSQAYLKRNDIDPESLSPIMKQAVEEAKTQSVLKSLNEKGNTYGVKTSVLKAVIKDNNVRTRLEKLNNLIYEKIKSATGNEPTYDWRTGSTSIDVAIYGSEGANLINRVNPIAQRQIQDLVDMRKQIANGMDPATAVLTQQVKRKLKTKEYIQEVLKKETTNFKEKMRAEVKANEPIQKQPIEFFKNPGTVEKMGAVYEMTKIAPTDPSIANTYAPYIDKALTNLKETESSKKPEDQRAIPDSSIQLNNIQKDYLYNFIGQHLVNKNEDTLYKNLEEELSPDNPERRFSFISTPEGKEDAAATLVYNWNDNQIRSIEQEAAILKQHNYDTGQEVDFDKISFFRNVYGLQPRKAVVKMKQAFEKAYHKAVIIKRAKPETQVPAELPILLTPAEIGIQLGQEAVQNLATLEVPQSPIAQESASQVNLPIPEPSTGIFRTFSSPKMTVGVETDEKGIITKTPPIVQKFKGQTVENLKEWFRKQGGNETTSGVYEESSFDKVIEKMDKEEATAKKEHTQKVHDIVYPLVEDKNHSVQAIHEAVEKLVEQNKVLPTDEELSTEMNLSLQEIRELRAADFQGEYPEISTDENEWASIQQVKGDVPLELTHIYNLLDECLKDISLKSYLDRIWLLERKLERKKGGKNAFIRPLKKDKKYREKAYKLALEHGWADIDEDIDYEEELLTTPEGIQITEEEQEEIKDSETAEQVKNLRQLVKNLIKQRPYIMKMYLDEMNQVSESMSKESKSIIKEAIGNLDASSKPKHVFSSMSYLLLKLNKFEDEARSTKLSDAEQTGGITFYLTEPTTIKTVEGPLFLERGEYDLYLKDKDNLTMMLRDHVVVIPMTELKSLMQQGITSLDWQRYYQDAKNEPFISENNPEDPSFGDDQEPLSPNAGVWRVPYSSSYDRWSKKIIKITLPERNAPVPIVIQFMNDHPWAFKLNDYFNAKFKTKEQLIKEKEDLRTFFKIPENATDVLITSKQFQQVVSHLVSEDLYPVFEYVLKNIKDHLKIQGVKGGGKEVYQKEVDVYSSLMAVASQEVVVNSYDPHNYMESQLGRGQHKTLKEAKAYLVNVKKFYDYFQVPTLSDADILKSREMLMWNLLVHPNVMHNDSLQRAILFYKAQIEMPLLEAQIQRGIYSNADIWKIVVEGYHKKGYNLKAQQNIKSGYNQPGLKGIEKPSREIRSHEEFVQRGPEKGWLPVDDFFNDNFQYMSEAYRSIKQSDTLKDLAKIPIKGPIEYFSAYDTELADANAKSPSPYTFNWVESEVSNNIQEEAKRLSGLTGKEITPQRVLQEGGWLQTPEHYGLDEWYKGSFYPPYMYKPLYDMAHTLFKPNPSFDDIEGAAKIFQLAKSVLTVVPTDQVAQYIGLMTVNRPPWKALGYMYALPARVLFHAARGATQVGPQIKKGEYTKTIGKTPEQIAWNRIFIEEGMVATAGYKQYLSNLIDKADKGIFPERQGGNKDLNDWTWSVLGMNQALMGEMVGQDILDCSIIMAESLVAKGYSVREAAKATVHYMNTASWNLNKAAYQGEFGVMARNILISRNMTFMPIRALYLMSRAITGNYKTNFRSLGGGSSGGRTRKGAWANVMTGADIPERFMPLVAQRLLQTISMLFLLEMVTKHLLQYAFSLMDDSIDPIMLHNPRGYEFTIHTPLKDINGNPVYLDYGLFKLTRNLRDLLATIVDPILEAVHIPHQIGRGIVPLLQSKMGLFYALLEAGGLIRDQQTGDNVYDVTEKASWNNAKRFADRMGTFAPIQPYFGEPSVKVPFSKVPLFDILLRSASIIGFNLGTGPREEGPISAKDFVESKRTVTSEKFKEKEDADNLKTEEAVMKAFNEGRISGEQVKNAMDSIKYPKEQFMTENKKVLFNATERNRAKELFRKR